MAQQRSNKFIELRHYPGTVNVEAVEGSINAELEELQKIPNVRIDHVYVKPVMDPTGNGFFYFAQISGRRIIYTQPKKEETHVENYSYQRDSDLNPRLDQ
jgi:hypothetical protein